MIVPFCVFFVADAERLPYFLTWNFFKEKLNLCLVFLFLGVISYCIWQSFAAWVYSFIENTAVLSWKEVSLLLLGYVSLFYLMSFNAVLLGLIAKKSKAVSESAVVKEQKVPVQKENKPVEKTEVKKSQVKKTSTVKKAKKTVRKSKTSKK